MKTLCRLHFVYIGDSLLRSNEHFLLLIFSFSRNMKSLRIEFSSENHLNACLVAVEFFVQDD